MAPAKPKPPAKPADPDPLIPVELCDVPTQRLYIASALALLQAYKLYRFLDALAVAGSLRSADTSAAAWATFSAWTLVDAVVFAAVVPGLRVPRLRFGTPQKIVLCALMALENWILFGSWSVSLHSLTFLVPAFVKGLFDYDTAVLESRVRLDKLVSPSSHILGKVTIHVLPHSTAQLNPSSQCYCLDPASSAKSSVSIPVLFNNSVPHLLQYSVQDFTSGHVQLVNLTSKDLLAVSKSSEPSSSGDGGKDRRKSLEEYALEAEREVSGRDHPPLEASGSGSDGDHSDWWALSKVDSQPLVQHPLPPHELHHPLPHSSSSSHHHPASPRSHRRPYGLERTQSLYRIPVSSIGLVTLRRVLDSAGNDIGLSRSEALVVQCPDATFARPAPSGRPNLVVAKRGKQPAVPATPVDTDRCVGDHQDLGLTVSGLVPLTLFYHRQVDGVKVPLKLENLSPRHLSSPLALQTPSSSAGGGGDASSIDPDALELSRRLASASAKTQGDVSWAAAQTVAVPLDVPLDAAGTHVYRLDSVRDACGHTVDFATLRDAASPSKGQGGSKARVDVRAIKVHPRAQVAFDGCGTTDEPVRLLKGREVDLGLRIRDKDAGGSAGDLPWTIGVRFSPPEGSQGEPTGKGGQLAAGGWSREISASSRTAKVTASEPGTYEVTSLRGAHCSGDVLIPSSCTVVEQPLPSVSLNFSRITDQCSGEIGLTTRLTLLGAPPFKVHYTVGQKGRGQPQRRVKLAQYSRDEIVIQPEQPGTWEYVFEKLEDRYYSDVRIVGQTVQQVVHPLATAHWRRGGGGTEVIWSCGGETVQAEVELRGAGPYAIEYQILGAGRSGGAASKTGNDRPIVVRDLQGPRATIPVDVPERYIKQGGKFMLSLVSIQDANGCKRQLTVPDLPVEVHRTEPTARFYVPPGGERSALVREDDEVRLPLRLTGEAPWTVEYRQKDAQSPPREVVVRSANAELSVSRKGIYELVSVRDKRCPGTVEPGSTFEIKWLPRPSLSLAQGTGELANGVFVRPPVCEMTEDSIDLVFKGTPPFGATYRIIQHGKKDTPSRDKTIQAVQNEATLALFTSEAGTHEYEIASLSDSVYSSQSRRGLVGVHRSGTIRVRQQVYARPSGSVKLVSKASFCVSEALSSTSSRGVKVDLTGQAPFDIEVEVFDASSKIGHRYPVHVSGHSSVLQLPHEFRAAGTHWVSVRKVRDAHGCERSIERQTADAAAVEVAEIASISPISHQPHQCVGDSLDFILQGSAPWTIKYEFNGKRSSATVAKDPRFSRIANEPGVFRITGVSHQSDQCTAKVEVEKVVRPLPTVQIQSGRNYVENIREGDQSEIVFHFTGEPPFSFTYTRSAPQDRSHDKTVLESRTVTGIQEKQYSIFAREEGTWVVTFVQDAYCSFPPASAAESKMLRS